MRTRIITIGLSLFGAASLTGLAVAAANTVSTSPSRAVVTHQPRSAGILAGVEEPTTTTVPEVDTVDEHGTDDPATHDVGEDRRDATTPGTVAAAGRHGADDPAIHDVGDDNGADDPATHDVGDDHGGTTTPTSRVGSDDHRGVSGSGDRSGPSGGSDDHGGHGSDG
jgi:hypothetical protein